MLWYLDRLLSRYGSSLEEAATRNIEKLKKRYPNGFKKEDSINRDQADSRGTYIDCYTEKEDSAKRNTPEVVAGSPLLMCSDPIGCTAPPSVYCACVRCSRETPDEVFYSCHHHERQVSEHHVRIRGRLAEYRPIITANFAK